MEFIKTPIPDIILIKPKLNKDKRGYFVETFRKDKLEKFIGYKLNFCQDNETKSNKGVLRGLHFQIPPFAQSKLVRVIKGQVLDVSVDIRQDSPTFGKHVLVNLSGENKHQLFIPRGFAHGFVVLSTSAIFSYKVDNYYSKQCEGGLFYNDPTLGINWAMPKNKLQLSKKDLKLPTLDKLNNEISKFNYLINLYE
jgi:dTDP-4-dehydrorhamnose 3,5-epimerase